MSLPKLVRCCLLALTLVGVLVASAEADTKHRRKKDEILQDPMETENSPPAVPPTDPGTAGSSGGRQGGGGGGGGHSQGASGSGSGDGSGSAPASDKAGRWMFNVKIGPAFAAYNGLHSGAIELDLGWSVLPNRNAYILLPLQFQFTSGGGAVMVPVGFQYDIQLARKGLYVYPRLSMGYAALLGGSSTVHAGVFIPELGVKYILRGRWNFGGEFFSLPVLFGRVTTLGAESSFATVFYRLMLYAGVTF